jgi:hypothetical protein
MLTDVSALIMATYSSSAHEIASAGLVLAGRRETAFDVEPMKNGRLCDI